MFTKVSCLLISVLTVLSLSAAELSKNFSYKDFEAASKASDFIRFDMESTKLGFITTKFHGYVKKITIKGIEESGIYKSVVVTLNVIDMDTDSGMRNDKMHDQCFDYKKTPKIIVSFLEAIDSNQKELKNVNATMNLRGVNKPVKLNLTFYMKGDQARVKGSGRVTLSALGIPDPSIIIASVRNEVDISLDVALK